MEQSYKLIIDVNDFTTRKELLKMLEGLSNLLFDEKFGKKITRKLMLKEKQEHQIKQFTLVFDRCICDDIFPFEPKNEK